MTVTRTSSVQHGRRRSYRAPARLDLRLLPPMTAKALAKVRSLSTVTLASPKSLVVAACCSSAGTAAFLLGGFALFSHR